MADIIKNLQDGLGVGVKVHSNSVVMSVNDYINMLDNDGDDTLHKNIGDYLELKESVENNINVVYDGYGYIEVIQADGGNSARKSLFFKSVTDDTVFEFTDNGANSEYNALSTHKVEAYMQLYDDGSMYFEVADLNKGMGLSDRVNYSKGVKLEIEPIKGTYKGRVPIDIELLGNGEVNDISVQYIKNGIWRNAFITNGKNLIAINSSSSSSQSISSISSSSSSFSQSSSSTSSESISSSSESGYSVSSSSESTSYSSTSEYSSSSYSNSSSSSSTSNSSTSNSSSSTSNSSLSSSSASYFPAKEVIATGGIKTTVGEYTIHTFTENGVFEINTDAEIDVLVVAGGGGTGYDVGGGGGAGGLVYQSNKLITTKANPVTVGKGGASGQSKNVKGENGEDSTFLDITAIGGGGGGSYDSSGAGRDGGSGGGGGDDNSPGGLALQGNSGGGIGYGYNGGASNGAWGSGGGGGAGGPGQDGISGQVVAGGIGRIFDITGEPIEYAIGGYGSADGTTPTDVIPNRGHGANGVGNPNASPYNGGSGVVIIRYKTYQYSSSSSSSTESLTYPAKYRLWWETDCDEYNTLTTKLKFGVKGYSSFQVSDIITVDLDVAKAQVPLEVIENWNSPTTDTTPEITYLPINVEGHTVEKVKFETSQYFTVNKEKKYGLENVNINNLIYDKNYLRFTGDKPLKIYDEQLLTDGLIFATHLNKGYDYAGKRNVFEIGTYVDDKYGNTEQALNMSESSDMIKLLSYPNEEIYLETYTFTAWFKLPFENSATDWWTMLSGLNHHRPIIIRKSDGQLGFYNNNIDAFSSVRYSINNLSTEWHFISATSDGSNTFYYIDAEWVGTSSYAMNDYIGAIGNYQDGGQQIGVMDEIRIYNRILTEKEMKLLYTGGKYETDNGYCTDVIDAGSDVDWNSFSYMSNIPNGTNLSFKFKTALEEEDVESLEKKEWIKPKGTEPLIFTEVGTQYFTIPEGWEAIDVLVVAGGGGGGMDMGGGGGGGGVIYKKNYPVITGDTIEITVGKGGKGAPAAGTEGQPTGHPYTIPATNGENSVFGTLVAIGGGAGGSSYYDYTPESAGSDGGSGGGASGYSNGGTKPGGLGVAGQGFDGGRGGGQYYSGGGGGAGGKGTDSTARANGGQGVYCDILGIGYYWAGGGGGSGYSIDGGDGGIGGGGGGAVGTTLGGAGYNDGQPGGGGSINSQTNRPGGDAGANTGGGGGGGSHYNANNKGGEGGSGIVIIKPKLKEVHILNLKRGRYLEWQADFQGNDLQNLSPYLYELVINYQERDFIHTDGWENIKPLSFRYDNYTDWRKSKGYIDRETNPGSISMKYTINDTLITYPDIIDRKIDNLYVYENTNGGCGNSRADFESKDYTYGPVQVPNVNGSGYSIINGRADYYAHKFKGYVFAPEDGIYTFATNSDDGSDLSIDGTVICSYYGCHGTGGWHTGTVTLTTGWHEFTYYHSENTGGAAWYAGWQKPSDSGISIIPESNLAGTVKPLSTEDTIRVFYESYVTGIVDAKEDVDFGMYESKHYRPAGTGIKFEFRSATNNEGQNALNSKTFQTATNNEIPVSRGRYLEWKITLTTDIDNSPRVDSFVIWCWKGKYFYSTYDEWNSCEKGNDIQISVDGTVTSIGNDNVIEDYVDAGKDVVWQYWANDDRGNIEYYYRTATEEETRFALAGKNWIKLDNKKNLNNTYGRYLGWKAIISSESELKKSVFSHNRNEIKNKTLSLIPDNKLGKLDIQTIAKDNIHSIYQTTRDVRSYILIDDNIVQTNLTPIFQWTNVVDNDIPRQKFQYAFQLIAKENAELLDRVYEYSKNTTQELNDYQSKDSSVIIIDDTITLDSNQTTGEIIYRLEATEYKIFNKLIATDNNLPDNTNNQVKYQIRTSEDGNYWTDWLIVQRRDSFLNRGKYLELKITLEKQYGYEIPFVSKFVIEAWDGDNMFIVDEDPSGATQFDSSVGALLLNDRHYYYRVKAFDGVEFSYWSRTNAIWTHTEEAPDAPTGLKTENMINPPQIISFNPDFTWVFNQSGHSQGNARVQVGTSSGIWNMWDSGKQPTNSGLTYDVNNLDRGHTYYWRVRVWNESDVASPYSTEEATFKLNQLPTKPVLINAEE